MKVKEILADWVAAAERLREHPVLASLRYGVMWSLVPAAIAIIPLYYFVSPEHDWNLRVMDAYLASLGLMGPFSAFLVARYLSKFYKVNSFAGAVALAVYLSLLPAWPHNMTMILDLLRNTFTSGPFIGFFLAIALGGLVVRLRMKWPAKRFAAEAVGLFCGFLMIAFTRFNHLDFHQMIRVFIGTHIRTADNLSAGLLIIVSMNALWYFGLQGSAIIGSFITGVYAQLAYDNMQAAFAGKFLPHVVTLSFLNYVFIGGAGTTFSLPLLMIFARSRKIRVLGGASLLPVFFNVNESLIYLMPLVLNTYFFIPFMLGPVFTTITTYFAVLFGWIPRFAFYVPGLYYLPAPIMGTFATTPNFSFPRSAEEFRHILQLIAASGSWKTGILSLMQIVVITLMYIPFFRAFEKKAHADEQRQKLAESSKDSSVNYSSAVVSEIS